MRQRKNSFLLNTYARFENSFDYGQGATLVDFNGKQFIDFSSGIGVTSVGHNNSELNQTIINQIQKVIHTSNLYNISPQEELATKIQSLANYNLYSFFGNSGAEANEGAIKIVRKYGFLHGKRDKIVTLKNSFHGRTLATLKATGQKEMHSQFFEPFPNGFLYADSISEIINLIKKRDDIAGVIIELIQGEGGVNALPKTEVQLLAEELKKRDILLAVDEVQTGIYRTGEFLASNFYKIKPDVITLAKGLGGGIPIGVVATTLKDIFQNGEHGSTFGGNFLATTSALKVLEILEKIYKNGELQNTISYFDKKLDETISKFPTIFKSKKGVGLMRGLEVVESIPVIEIVKNGNKNRVLLLKSGQNILRFLPPLTISEIEINRGFEKLFLTLKESF
jgi:acetylornithine aminotransferase